MSSDINQILHPQILPDLREDIPPVQCIIWKGGNNYESITFEEGIYPFDSLDQIKRLICYQMDGDPRYLPKFLFIGVPVGDRGYEEDAPEMQITYLPFDYLWYPLGSTNARNTYLLNHPVRTLSEPDTRFVLEDGSYASPNYESRSRTTLEQAFLKPRGGRMPVLHVFPFFQLYNAYKGAKPISEMEWNKKFAPYFPDLSSDGPFEPNRIDVQMGYDIRKYITQRQNTVDRINEIVTTASSIPSVYLTGIQQMTLIWNKKVNGFQGCAAWFYPFKVTKNLPYVRLLPADSTPITKLHVEGILPIPSLYDPRIIEQWNKELSPTPKEDFCTIKYIHRQATQSTPPIYGTIHLMNDSTMKLNIQPPKTIKKLSPEVDFRNFEQLLQGVFQGLPQSINDLRIHELSGIFTIKTSLQTPKFKRDRLLARLPTFQTFFREIKPLPEESPILSLRYKAVSQYVSENEVFAFITQWSTQLELEEGMAPPQAVLDAIQNEFQFSRKEAIDIFTNWYKRKGQFVVESPEEGEFSEEFHPGVDIHIYANHPTYTVHVYRIDNEDTYRRIYTLLSVLFIEEDGYFEGSSDLAEDMEKKEQRWEMERLKANSKKEEEVGAYDEKQPIAESIQENEWLGATNDPLADVEMAPRAPIIAQAMQAVKPIIRKDEKKRVQPKQWFIRKLQELDQSLFGFSAEIGGDNEYTRMCQASDDRQPVILTKDQYQDMRARYENDPIYWIIYPLEGKKDPEPPVGQEIVTIMKYGSDADHIHYMFCPHFFCIYDEIMVLESDFESEFDREGNPKPKNTCPFCYGGLITDVDRKKKVLEGKTVMERKRKKGSEYRHDRIGLFKKTSHPDGLFLPCCFIKQSTMRISDPAFERIRSQLQEYEVQEQIEEKGNMDEAGDQHGEGEIEESVIYYEARMVEYVVLFQSLYSRNILESNKHPDAGYFATADTRFDAYFHQDSSLQMVIRPLHNLHLRPNAHGFLRVGTDNTVNESLLGVITPLLNTTSIIGVKERFEEVITPRVFLNAHFGNLVLEFFDPTNQDMMPKTSHHLMKWAETNLGIRMTSANSYALLRIFNAYHRFITFIHSPDQRKELRHIQPLLAEPGLFTTNGLQLIILDDKGENQPIEARCPIFGVSMERHKGNDFAFVSRKMRKIGTTEKVYPHYELYIYTMNKMGRGGEREEHHLFTKWNPQDQANWPTIVTERVKEYLNQCQSNYRSIYTPQSNIAYSKLMPLSAAVQGSGGLPPEGIIKDHYNHLVGVTFRSKPGSSAMVIIPIVDDGVISVSSSFAIKKVYLDWEDIRLAPAEDVIRFYKGRLKQMFSTYTGYEIKYLVKNINENQVIAIQLENGIYVPVAPPQKQEELDQYALQVVTVESLESLISKQMSGLYQRGYQDDQPWEEWIQSAEVEKGCGKDDSLDFRMSVNELEEIYQQYRLMVARWLSSQKVGSGMRGRLEEIIFRYDLPDYEKRKRLYLLLSSTFLSWLYPDENWEMPTLSLLRKDCRAIPSEDGCTGTCRWKQTESGGKCLLHVPSRVDLDDQMKRSVDVTQLFTIRILDELARFPSRRKQLMEKNGISVVTKMVSAVRDGDQYIIPESSVTWLDLLRFDWMKESIEEPRYFEEMSREKDEEDEAKEEQIIPDLWVERFGDSTDLRIQWSNQSDTPFVPLMPYMGMSILDWGINTSTKTLTDVELKEFARKTNRSIGFIDFDTGDEELEMNFIKRKMGKDNMNLFVKINGKIGMVMNEDRTYLAVDTLPEQIQQVWKEVPVTLFTTRPQVAELHSTSVPTVQPMMANVKEKEPPLVKAIPSQPVVKAIPSQPMVKAIPSQPMVKAIPSQPVLESSSSSSSSTIIPVSDRKPIIISRRPPAAPKPVAQMPPPIKRPPPAPKPVTQMPPSVPEPVTQMPPPIKRPPPAPKPVTQMPPSVPEPAPEPVTQMPPPIKRPPPAPKPVTQMPAPALEPVAQMPPPIKRPPAASKTIVPFGPLIKRPPPAPKPIEVAEPEQLEPMQEKPIVARKVIQRPPPAGKGIPLPPSALKKPPQRGGGRILHIKK